VIGSWVLYALAAIAGIATPVVDRLAADIVRPSQVD
jgi:hypothetical protein